MALWDDDDNDQNQDDNQPATTGAGSPASAIGGLPMPSAPPVAPGVQPQGGGLGKYIPAALKGGLSGAGMGQPGMGPNGGAYGPTMGMQGGGMGAPRQSPGQMSMGLAQGGGKALGIGINQLMGGKDSGGGAPAVPSTGIPAGGYPGMATGAGPVAPTVGAAPAAAATDPLADAADATFANGGTVMGPRRYPALANGAMIQPSGGNGAGGWGQPQSMTRQPQWGNGQQQGPQQQGPQQWGGGPPMPSQMGGNPYNGVGYQPRMNMQSGGIPQQGGMPMQGQQMPQQMPVGTRPQPQGGYPGMGGTPAPQQGGGGFPMGQMQQGARPFSGGGWGGVGGIGPMAMGPAQQPQGGMPYAMANGGTVTGGGTSTAPGGSGSNPATNTFEWPPAKPGSSQLGTPALARGGVVLGPPEPPSMTAPGGTTYQQPGMVQRRYSPVNPIGPHVSFGPRPEDMGNHLPTRLPIGHRMSVRMPRPKVGGTGVGGAGKI